MAALSLNRYNVCLIIPADSTDFSILWSQVWFQNRRTKWRKKHAAEMATAKRKQEVLDNQTDENSDVISDVEEEHLAKRQNIQ